MPPAEHFFFEMRHSNQIEFETPGLDQACQTGGPLASCGSFACQMQPPSIISDPKITTIAQFLHRF
jgi:hypothetical protein